MDTNNKLVTDPVCGMEIDPATSEITSVYNYERYHFCTPLCKVTFELEPEKYVHPESFRDADQS